MLTYDLEDHIAYCQHWLLTHCFKDCTDVDTLSYPCSGRVGDEQITQIAG